MFNSSEDHYRYILLKARVAAARGELALAFSAMEDVLDRHSDSSPSAIKMFAELNMRAQSYDESVLDLVEHCSGAAGNMPEKRPEMLKHWRYSHSRRPKK